MIVIQYIRSIIFIFTMYLWMAILGTAGAIPALISKEWCYAVLDLYSRSVIWLMRVLCGLKYEIRGEVPTGACVVASKHQAFIDILIHFHVLSRPGFVMKQELKWAPILGWYAMRIGAAPVKRGDKGKAVAQMVEGAKAQGEENQLVIYPQGTRVPPGKKMPYKVGAVVLAQRMERPVILAATNVGVFWPKRGLLRKPGLAVVEYLEWMPEGLSVEDAAAHMEQVIEENSNRLMAEAGFQT